MSSILTRSEFVTKTADLLGRSLNGTTKSGATHKSILDEMYEWGQMRIAREFSFPEMDVRTTTQADTTAAVMEYSYDTIFGSGVRVKDILSVVIENGTSSSRLKRYLHRDLMKYHPYPEGESSNQPRIYTRVGNTLWLFPVPNDTYDIHTIHSKWPTRASGDSSYSDYDFLDDVIVAATAFEYFNHLQEDEQAAYWDKVFKMKLKETVNSIIHPTDWESEGRAFNSTVLMPGDFWNNPLIISNP